jgi:cholesterol oxidase
MEAEENFMHYDYLIVGSGFGGSVSALRLAEKGYQVAVLEQGDWVTSADMEEASTDLRKLLWMPPLGMKGFFMQPLYRHIGIVGGVGVGGGSLVYAAVLLRPKQAFFREGAWSALGVNWEKELAPHYSTAEKMLGVQVNPSLSEMDAMLRKTAEAMGAGNTWGAIRNGIYFGETKIMKADPFFGGKGPARTGCHLCGECLTGCPHGAKNTLDRNYLYLAQKSGAEVLPKRKVVNIIPLPDGGYEVRMKNPQSGRKYRPLQCNNLVLAGGVLGTLELLFRCRDVTKTLPDISRELGKVVRTNSEAIVGIMSPDPELDLTKGTTISSDFYPDAHTHITQNRFPRGYSFMRFYFGPLVDNNSPVMRSLVSLWKILAHPVGFFRVMFARNWHKRITVFTVMQHLDNQIMFKYGRTLSTLFLTRRLKSKRIKGKEAPTNLPVANRAAEVFAQVNGGVALNTTIESIGNLSVTAHILGGCHMGTSAENGAIDASNRLYGHPGILVVDGSAISANVGVNPSLTISAIAERAMSLIPPKEGEKKPEKKGKAVSHAETRRARRKK